MRKWILLLSIIPILSGCVYTVPETNRPGIPDNLIFNRAVKSSVKREDIVAYVAYLNNYSHAIEKYYDLTPKEVGREINRYFNQSTTCHVTKSLFNNIVLPYPPRTSGKESNQDIVDMLTNQVTVLRTKIRNKNKELDLLKVKYKHCF